MKKNDTSLLEHGDGKIVIGLVNWASACNDLVDPCGIRAIAKSNGVSPAAQRDLDIATYARDIVGFTATKRTGWSFPASPPLYIQ